MNRTGLMVALKGLLDIPRQTRHLLIRTTATLPLGLQDLNDRRTELIQNLKNMPEIRLNDKPVTKSAAVLIALCEEENGKVSLMYTLRSSLLKNHTRQVSFPGGLLEEEHDKSYEDCAVRETEEETGVPRECVNVWGTGKLLVPFKGNNHCSRSLNFFVNFD